MTDIPAAPAEPPIRQRVMRALGWALAGRLLAQTASWGMTLFVIRLLTPDDYGLMTLASIFMGMAVMVNELGMGAALIQTRELTHDLLRKALGLIMLVQTGFALTLILAAGPIAGFFHEPRLADILRVQSLQFVMMIFIIIPEALLMRSLNFRPKAMVELIATLAAGAATLAWAFHGYGVWALVWGTLVMAGFKAVGFTMLSSFYAWPKFSIAGMRGLLSFGGLMTVERMLWFGYMQTDNLIIGKRFGNELLGIYSIASQMAAMPVDKVGPVLGQVAFPAFAAVQGRRDDATAYMLKAVRLLALVGFPLLFGLSAVTPWFVPVVLGQTWMPALPLLHLLALAMPFRIVNLVLSPYLKGLGHARMSLENTVMACLLFPAAFLIGSIWGVRGIAMAWVVAYPIFFLLGMWRTSQVTPLRLGRVLEAVLRPAAAAAIMYAAVRAAGHALDPALPDAVMLVAMIALGGAVYLAVIPFIDRRGCREAIDMIGPRWLKARLASVRPAPAPAE